MFKDSFLSKNNLISLFIFAFFNSLLQIIIIKQLSASFPFQFKLSMNLILGLTIFSYGIGGLIARVSGYQMIAIIIKIPCFSFLKEKWNPPQQSKGGYLLFIAILHGLSIITSYVLLMKLAMDDPANVILFDYFDLIFMGLIVGFPLVLNGLLQARLFMRLKQDGISMGKVVGGATLGIAFGYIFAGLALLSIGINLLMIAIGLLSIISTVRINHFIVPLGIAICFFITPLDRLLEEYREVETMLWNFQYPDPGSRVFAGWSPYEYVELFEDKDTQTLHGAYNHMQQWYTSAHKGKDFELRLKLRDFIQSEDRLLIIGSGGGKGVLNYYVKSRNITAVELDPVVVELMKNNFYEYNDNVYNLVPTYAMDGRKFLDEYKDRYDIVIFEGTDYAIPLFPTLPLSLENYLYTKENFQQVFNQLSEDGVFIIYHIKNNNASGRIQNTLKEVGFIPQVFRVLDTYNELNFNYNIDLIVGYKSIERKNNLEQILLSLPLTEEITDELPQIRILTDDNPFIFFFMPEVHQEFNEQILFIIAAILIVLLLLILFRSNDHLKYLYFSSLGIGFIIFQLFFIAKLRSLIDSPITTSIIYLIVLNTAGAFGSFYYQKFLNKEWKAISLISYLVLLITSFIILNMLSIYYPSDIGKAALFILLILPFTFGMGLFFPYGLSLISEKQIATAIGVDSIGTAAGFFLFYYLSMNYGFNYAFIVGSICYLYILLFVFFTSNR